MIQRTKTATLAFFVILAASAFGASIAHAESYTAESSPATLTESQTEQTFTFGGLGLICTTASGHGEMSSTAESLEITPNYSNCHEEIFELNAVVTMNGCYYQKTAPVKEFGFTHAYWIFEHIRCPFGQSITWHTGTCTIHIPPQEFVSKVTVVQTTPVPRRWRFTYAESEIHYTESDGFLCPLDGPETNTDGTHSGESEIAGEDPSTEASINLNID